MLSKNTVEQNAPLVNHPEKELIVRPRHAWLTRQNLALSLRVVSLALALSVGILLVQLFLLPLLGIHDPFLLFLPAVAFLTWYLGYRAGLVMTGIATGIIAYFLLTPAMSWFHPTADYLRLLLFILSAVAIVWLIELSKRPTIVRKYEAREKEYQQLLFKLHRDYLQAQDEIRARDEFLSIASHELKTPLTAMLLQLQTVLHNIRNVSLANFSVENLLRMLDSAEQQSRRLSKMINDLLNVSLITTGRMDLEKESMDLSQTVHDCVERITEKAKRDGVTLTLHAEKELQGRWDKLRIEQAVTNLLTNALKYGNGRPVDVAVTHHGSRAVVTVRDHGIGIPAREQEKIFARFERAMTKHSIEGLGVGLYITKQIVEAHGGKISVESREHHGSTFTLSLPIQKNS
jgi:signal transduction histidine kinase